jgi:hypothetical protein
MKKCSVLICVVVLFQLFIIGCKKQSNTAPTGADIQTPPLAQCYTTTMPIITGYCDSADGIAVKPNGHVILSDFCDVIFDYNISQNTYIQWSCPQYA